MPSITSHICEKEGRREEHLAKKGTYCHFQFAHLCGPSSIWVAVGSNKGKPHPQVPDRICRRNGGHRLFPKDTVIV